jgi:sugar phosphate isomerase/epimerase
LLKSSAVSAAALPYLLHSSLLRASAWSLPIGLQLYTVGADFDRDPLGTLKQVAAIGYTQVELSPLSKTPPGQTKKFLDETRLRNPSGHYLIQDLIANLDQRIETARQLGQQYMVVTVPWVADPSRFPADPSAGPMGQFMAVLRGLTLDDWKWNADQFNRIGEEIHKAGLQLAYHNHNFDFKPLGTTTGYDEFLRLTDPSFVKLELDCGWMFVAGHDPIEYLNRHPDRYRLLHIKDFKKGFTPTTVLGATGPGAPIPTELGRGAIDYVPIFAAATRGNISASFVEQEPPFKDMPALDAIKVDYQYIHRLKG